MYEEYDLAITAHDLKKDELLNLVERYASGLEQLSIVATKKTGEMIIESTGLPVHLVEDGANGGYLHLGKLIADNRIKMVVFLQHPLTMDFDEIGIRLLLSACTLRNVPFASNLKTAEFVLHRYLDMKMAMIWRCPELSSGKHIADFNSPIVVNQDPLVAISNC